MHAPDPRIADLADELLSFLRRRAPRDAEELAQETWVRVTAAAPDTDARGFRAYAFTVARRLLIDRYRQQRRRGPLVELDGGLAAPSDPHSDAVAGQTLAVVEATLAAMKPEVAQVFRWRTTSALSFKDIAERQGCSINTALGRHHQATKRLARALRDAGLGVPS
jgi:RNA polymerase sigma-70 factor (ECF subfamily)